MNILIDSIFHDYYSRHPIMLVDIGASGGLSENWKRCGKYLEVIGFEPDSRSFRDLQKQAAPDRTYINGALHRDKGTVDFYLTEQKTLSSVLKPLYDFLRQFPEMERYKIRETARIETDSLDNRLANSKIMDIDFIKLDTQGSELPILEGAGKSLGKVVGIEIELEFNQIYEGQPLFSGVDSCLRNFGFHIFDLKPYYWKREKGRGYGGPKGQLIFADALYLLDVKCIAERLSHITDSIAGKAKVLKLISIALLYGYVDYAVEIFSMCDGLFSQNEIAAFNRFISKNIHPAGIIPSFPGKGRIANFFKRLYSSLRYTHNGWGTTQEHLGNID